VNDLTVAHIDRLKSALASTRATSGTTHGFYLYPARFSPETAHAVIETFSLPGDCVLDPFMGGGTSVVEGLPLGRTMVGLDLNALAHFVAATRTRPLSSQDHTVLRSWAKIASRNLQQRARKRGHRVTNLPLAATQFLARAIHESDQLRFPRQRAFARAVLLRLGQWALDCRDQPSPLIPAMAAKLPQLMDQMLNGLDEFVKECALVGLKKHQITAARILLCRSSEGLQDDPRIRGLPRPPSLVFTSPPYPGVHVLYHRWQLRGRKETPAPYWIAGVEDGFYSSHYTGGSRTSSGEDGYFSMIRSVFSSVRQVIASDGLVVQLVGFADVSTQLPRFQNSMAEAGFVEWTPAKLAQARISRRVPNRKWYAKIRGTMDTSSELLLFHRPYEPHTPTSRKPTAPGKGS